jgi:hypothetical protein
MKCNEILNLRLQLPYTLPERSMQLEYDLPTPGKKLNPSSPLAEAEAAASIGFVQILLSEALHISMLIELYE